MRVSIDIEGSACIYGQYLPYIPDDEQAKLVEAAQKVLGSYWELKVGQFFECLNGNFECIGIKNDECEMMAQLMWVRGFKGFVETMMKVLQRYEVKQTADEKLASASCEKMSFEESTLVFLQRYFGLHSFEEAEELPLSNFVISKKAAYNKATFERKAGEIQKKRLNEKSKRK